MDIGDHSIFLIFQRLELFKAFRSLKKSGVHLRSVLKQILEQKF